MWIILEGVDGSGKSTMMRALERCLVGSNYKVGHLGPPATPDDAILDCLTGGIDLEDVDRVYRPGGAWDLLSDRLNMGCPVYGPIFRPHLDTDGYGDFGRAGWRYVELYLASRGAVTFLIQVSAETAIRRVLERNDENFFSVEKIVETLPALVDRYDWLAADSLTIGPRIVEPSLDELDGWAHSMLAIAAVREELARPLDRYDDYIGPTNPEMLIVCEPIRDTRLAVLDELSDCWQRVGFCSSAHTAQDLTDLWRTLGFPSVIGLGELPQDAESFLWNSGDTVTDDAVEAAKVCNALLD